MVICLERGADLYMAQLMPLPLTLSLASVESRLVLPFWYQLTRVVPEKGRQTCVCVSHSMDKVVQEGCSAVEHKAVTDHRLHPWFAVAYIIRLRAYGLLLQPRPTA